jgi:type I restriction enzyme R subunit
LIFDICANFEFFYEFPDGLTPKASKSLSQLIFETKLDIVMAIYNNQEPTEEEELYCTFIMDDLHKSIQELDESRFEVRKHWKYVIEYKARSKWNNLTNGAVLDIKNNLSHLISYKDDTDELAKRFDVLIGRLQLALINQSKAQKILITNIVSIAQKLFTKRNIPAVHAKITLIEQLKKDSFWPTITITQLEKIRTELRSLIQFLKDEDKETPVYTDFTDELHLDMVKEVDVMGTYTSLKSYKDRVEAFIRKNRTHLVIDKLYKNLPITTKELESLEQFLLKEALESKDRFIREYGVQPLGKFVRNIIGLDIEVTNQLFAEFISQGNLNANQITFIQKIINYLNQNGIIEKQLLTQSPFNEQHDQGVFGIFPEEDKFETIIKVINQVNLNAGYA